jgi:folate-dependent phosphoribosylglycinamide formyltransferase PurN
MRIVFLAVDDEFAGRMQRHLYKRHPEWVVGSVLAVSPIYKKSGLRALLFVLRRSGFVYGWEMFRMKIVRNLRGGERPVTPSRLARQNGVEIAWSKNINEQASLNRLAAWTPDIIISTNFNHYIGMEVRRSAGHGTWNLHKSYLPHYRGMAPSFYALLNGERAVGATLHQVAKGFDTGDILRQVRVPIEQDDTVYTLNQKTSDAGGRMLDEFLHEYDPTTITASPQPLGNWPNYSYPTRADVKAFRTKGCRF